MRIVNLVLCYQTVFPSNDLALRLPSGNVKVHFCENQDFVKPFGFVSSHDARIP